MGNENVVSRKDIKSASGFSPSGIREWLESTGAKVGAMGIVGKRLTFIMETEIDGLEKRAFVRTVKGVFSIAVAITGHSEKDNVRKVFTNEDFDKLTGSKNPESATSLPVEYVGESDSPEDYGLAKGIDFN